MRLLRNLVCMVVMTTMLGMWSCTKSGNGYYDYVSDDAAVLAKCDMAQVMKNAGIEVNGDRVTIPQNLQMMLGGDAENLKNLLSKMRGVDPRNIMIVLPEINSTTVVLVTLTDKSDFEQSLVDLEWIKESAGIYRSDDSDDTVWTVIAGDIAVITPSQSGKSIDQQIQAMKEKAEKSPVAQWKRDAMDHDDALRMLYSNRAVLHTADVPSIASMLINQCYDGNWSDGYTDLEIDLEGRKAEVQTVALGPDGGKLNNLLLGQGIDRSMYKYTSPQDFAVMLLSLDMDKVNEVLGAVMSMAPEASDLINPLLSTLDGQLMVSGGVQNIQTGEGLSVNAVLKARRGKASDVINAVRDMLGNLGVPCMNTGDGIIVLAGFTGVSVRPEGDYVVVNLSDNRQGGSDWVKSSDLGDDAFEAAVRLPKNQSAITGVDLPFSALIRISSESDGSEMEVELSDTNLNVLEALIELASMH